MSKYLMNKFVLIFIFMHALSFAAEPPVISIPGQIDRVMQREQQQATAKAKEDSTDVFFGRPTKTDIGAKVTGGKCFKVDKIDISGASLLSKSRKKKLLKPFVGKCLSIVELNNIVTVISNYYLDKGSVTSRAFLTQQDITDKQLDILVVEGKVGKVAILSKKARFENKTAFPGVEGKPLNLRDIEMGIERMNRLASNEAKSSLVPAKDFGVTDIDVTNNSTRPFHFNLQFDNYGGKSTGDNQISGGIIWDNPLGINDRIIVNLNGTSKQGHNQSTRGNSISYQVPYGYWLFDLGYSKFDYKQSVIGLNEIFRSTGESITYVLGTGYIFHRNQDSKSKISFNLKHKNNKNFIEDVLIGVSSRKLTIGTLALNHYKVFKGGRLDLTLAGHRGLKWFNAEQNLGGDNPKAQFSKYTLDLSLLKQFNTFNKTISFLSSLHIQESADNLYGTEQLYLGSLYTVRGFKDSSISGNSGWYFRNELSVELPVKGLPAKVFNNVYPYIAYDIGEIKSDKYVQGSNLSGATIGIRLIGKHASVDMSWSKPIEKPAGFTDDNVFLASLRFDY